MLGKNIRRYRKLAGMTQQVLANKIKKERSVIARYELGNIHMTVGTLVDIARALKVTPLDLINGRRPK